MTLLSLKVAPSPESSPPAVRADFPILDQEVNGKPLVYFDNAATTQKPRAVIDRISRFLAQENANIRRGVHYLSMRATYAYAAARSAVAGFINARSDDEIVFVRGTTEAINLVAKTFAKSRLEEGDEVLVSVMEHHANIVPWQMVAGERGATLKVVPMTDQGELTMESFAECFSEKTKLVAIIHVSNVLGTVNPVKEMVDVAHAEGVPVLVDGAQAVAHMPVDVQDIGADFYVFSSHKMFGPDGVGVLYGKAEHLETMPPYQGGGDMIERVSFAGTTFRNPPERFEAGTPCISGAIGLAAAIEYLQEVGWDAIKARESELLAYVSAALGELEGLHVTGTSPGKVGVFSFVLDGVHPHDVGTILDSEGVAVRAGHHCAQPLMERLGVTATTRASLAFYNSEDEIDRFVGALRKVRKWFG